uniref:Ephrin_rec_like domain-containing protein n=1 Tax=Macrostomum lignano TaxID=282301 RepID=A0A1I8FMX6_9PLAT
GNSREFKCQKLPARLIQSAPRAAALPPSWAWGASRQLAGSRELPEVRQGLHCCHGRLVELHALPCRQLPCVKCPAGTSSKAGAEECSKCQPGHFSPPGAAACKPLPSRRISTAGASACHRCPAGSFSVAGASACHRLPGRQGRLDLHPLPCRQLLCYGRLRLHPAVRPAASQLWVPRLCTLCPCRPVRLLRKAAKQCKACPPGTFSDAARRRRLSAKTKAESLLCLVELARTASATIDNDVYSYGQALHKKFSKPSDFQCMRQPETYLLLLLLLPELRRGGRAANVPSELMRLAVAEQSAGTGFDSSYARLRDGWEAARKLGARKFDTQTDPPNAPGLQPFFLTTPLQICTASLKLEPRGAASPAANGSGSRRVHAGGKQLSRTMLDGEAERLAAVWRRRRRARGADRQRQSPPPPPPQTRQLDAGSGCSCVGEAGANREKSNLFAIC